MRCLTSVDLTTRSLSPSGAAYQNASQNARRNASQSAKRKLNARSQPIRFSYAALAVLSNLVLAPLPGRANPEAVNVRVDRWLMLQQFTGSVTFFNATGSRPAQQGDRLRAIGDGIVTGQDAAATLAIDTDIGTVEVAADTQLSIQALDVNGSDGYITRLRVDRGRVQLKVRPFTNPDSQLELETPVGTSGVRGTEFGVSLQPDGKMGVATLTGNVITAAQDQEVMVPSGFQNVTLPGEPPSPPVPFTNQPRLDYRVERLIQRGIRRVRLVGQVDPTSTVTCRDAPQAIDRNGRFELTFPARSRLRVKLTVTTPLGQEQTYELDLL